jgi:putative endonuclease
MHDYYVYILECADKSYYVGVTNDIDRRLIEHNTGINKKAYTYSRRPVVVKYVEHFQYINDAIRWEKQVKGWNRLKKEALIRGDWQALKVLAQCKNTTSHTNFNKEDKE